MSVKRQATTELNHDNWDQEDTANVEEDTEGFKMASKDVLEKRVIRTAKRRSTTANNDGQKSVFSGFGGFNKAQKTSFDFLANLTNGNKANTSLASPSILEGTSSSPFTSKPFTSITNSGGFTALGTSTTVQSMTSSTNQSSLFSKSTSTSPSGPKFPLTETKLDTTVSQNESPFKIQANSLKFPLTETELNTTVSQNESPFKIQVNSPKFPLTETKLDTTVSQNESLFKIQANSLKFPLTETKLNTTVSQNESPFKIQANSPKFPLTETKLDTTVSQNESPFKIQGNSPKFPLTETKLNTTVSQNESPFKIQANSSKFPLTETKLNTTVGQNESPFKIPACSTPNSSFSFATKSSTVPNPITQTSSSLFIDPNPNLPSAFAKSSPFKMSSTAISSASPTKNDKSFGNNDSLEKKESGGDKNEVDEKKINYYTNIKGLNVSVSDWIKKHVEESPICILTPIFRDYEKHLKEIQDEYFNKESKPNGEKGDFKQNLNSDTKSTSAPTASSLFSNSSTPPKINTLIPDKTNNISFGIPSPNNKQPIFTGSSFGNIAKAKSPTLSSNPIQTLKTSSGFSFGINSTTTSTTGLQSIASTNAGFSFGINSPSQNSSVLSSDSTVTSTNGNSTFSFGIGKPFSFNSNIQKKEEESNQNNANKDEDEPPKVEFTPLVEENSVFDKKCKIFFKKDGNFVDKGVSTLYIKKIEESGKHQLLVRANTSLGNVLLNLVLSSSIPTQRMGKNNVMLVCIPTPDAKPPPTPVLVRVKTSEEADNLLETLNKYKM